MRVSRKVFNSIDKDGTGAINRHEFLQYMLVREGKAGRVFETGTKHTSCLFLDECLYKYGLALWQFILKIFEDFSMPILGPHSNESCLIHKSQNSQSQLALAWRVHSHCLNTNRDVHSAI